MKLLLKNIVSKYKELQKCEFSSLDEAEFYAQYHYTIINYHQYLDGDSIPKSDLFMLIYRTKNQTDDFNNLKKLISDNEQLLTDIIGKSIFYLKYEDILEQSNDLIVVKLDDDIIKNTIFDNEEYRSVLKEMSMFLKLSKSIVFNSIMAQKKYESEIKDMEPKKIEKICDNMCNKVIRSSNIDNILYKIRNREITLVNANNKFTTKTNNMAKSYKRLLETIKDTENVKLPFIIDRKMLENIDDEVIYDLYRAMSIINYKYYGELINIKEKLTENETNTKKCDLKKMGYDIDSMSNSKINFILNYGTKTELEKVFNYISKLDYKLIDIYSDNGIYILVNTNYDIIIKINELIKNNIININFLRDYPQIFFDKDIVNDVEGYNSKLTKNVNILKKKYDLSNSNINELLLSDNEYLKSSVNTLQKYSLKLNTNILKNTKLLDYVDLFIELGLKEYIVNNINEIDKKSELIYKRCYIANLIGLNILEKNKINPIILDKNFYVDNSSLDEYIINNTNDYIDINTLEYLNNHNRNKIENFDLSLIDNYLMDDLTYNFDGILISKNKILRNINCLNNSNLNLNNTDLIFNSIIYGSILNKEQIEQLKNIIYSKKYIKK